MRTNRSGQSALLLLDVVRVLAVEHISYVVIGAMAASVHGTVRATMDADALLSLAIQEAPQLEREFKTAGFKTELRLGDSEDPIAAVLGLTDSFDNRVDLLIGLRGQDPLAFSRAVEIDFKGMRLRVVGLEDFIAMKAFAGSPQDLADAKAAILAAGNRLDETLLAALSRRFGRESSTNLDQLLGEVAQLRDAATQDPPAV